MHHVMLEPFATWDLDIGQPQPDPPVVIEQTLSMYNPARQLDIITHNVDATAPPSRAPRLPAES
jgi:hypothetical protein